MTLRHSKTGEPWRGARIEGIAHPLNIETLWSGEELAKIGLEKVPPPPPAPVPSPRRLVSKSTIVMRLKVAGKLGAAMTALRQNDEAFAQFFMPGYPYVYADDVATVALLSATGADAAAILAAEE